MRWPHIQWPREFNMDESQLLAEGMRFLAHPWVPWRDVDGTTSGPLNYAVLSVPLFFGAPASWQTARMTLWAVQCLTLIFLYLALRNFGSRAEAQFVLMLKRIFFMLSRSIPISLITPAKRCHRYCWQRDFICFARNGVQQKYQRLGYLRWAVSEVRFRLQNYRRCRWRCF